MSRLRTTRAALASITLVPLVPLVLFAAAARAAPLPAASAPSFASASSPALADWRHARPVVAAHAMVVTEQKLATEVGLDVLRRGGNAVDAAVAIGYALAVVDPCCGNIGGGGFMTVHLADGHDAFLDFRETAPRRATATMFQNPAGQVVAERSTRSWLGVGVPGTVAGLEAARQRFGSMERSALMRPAIDLARDGFVLGAGDAALLQARSAVFARHPETAAIFLNHGRPLRAGDRLRQPQLARSLELVERDGADAFYRGPVARAVVAASRREGGILEPHDFASYVPEWGAPLRCAWRGRVVLTSPPPGSGAVLCEILGALDPLPLERWGWASARTTHAIAEAERQAFADRNTRLGDPEFVDPHLGELLSPQHAQAIRDAIARDRATPSEQVHGSAAGSEGVNTTHYSVVDAMGNAVAVTYTINDLFGSGIVAAGTGILMNDELDDFTSKPGVPNLYGLVQGSANAIAPGKRPLSSMTPTIVLRDGRVELVTGSPGGSTIVSTTLQTILATTVWGMTMQQAVAAPRMHMQWYPDRVFVEPGYLQAGTRVELERMGYALQEIKPWGAAESIRLEGGRIEGASDPRRPAGAAAGY